MYWGATRARVITCCLGIVAIVALVTVTRLYGGPIALTGAAIHLACVAALFSASVRPGVVKPEAWRLVAVTMAMVSVVFVADVFRGSQLAEWSIPLAVGTAGSILASVFGAAATARFVEDIPLQGRNGHRIRSAVIGLMAVLSVAAHWARSLDASQSADMRDWQVTAWACAVAVVVSCAALPRVRSHLRYVSPGYSALIIGLMWFLVGGAVSPGVLPGGIRGELAGGCSVGAALTFALAIRLPGMRRAAESPASVRSSYPGRWALPFVVAFHGMVVWRHTDGPYPAYATTTVLIALGSALAVAILLAERHRADRAGRRPLSGRSRQLADDLPGGLRRGDLTLHFQPIVRVSDGAIAGAEALVRWNHAEFGPIPARETLLAARASAVMDQFDRWVIHRALTDGSRLRDQLDVDEVYISFNVSASSIRRGFASLVGSIASAAGVDPNGFVVELTERDDIADVAVAVQEIAALQDLGFLVALDDFGSGHANLSQLHRFDVDIVKFDGELVRAACEGRRGESILRAATGLARDLGMIVIVEGVEQPSMVDTLAGWGAHYAQGWACGFPVPVEDLMCASR